MSIDFLQLSKAAKAAAKDCIANARRNDPQCHHTHRGVEILAIDHLGERIGDPLDYIDVKQLSGKRLATIVNDYAPAQFKSITVQGGLDCHESFEIFMKYPDDYEPMTDTWEVDSDDEAESAKRERSDSRDMMSPGNYTDTGDYLKSFGAADH